MLGPPKKPSTADKNAVSRLLHHKAGSPQIGRKDSLFKKAELSLGSKIGLLSENQVQSQSNLHSKAKRTVAGLTSRPQLISQKHQSTANLKVLHTEKSPQNTDSSPRTNIPIPENEQSPLDCKKSIRGNGQEAGLDHQGSRPSYKSCSSLSGEHSNQLLRDGSTPQILTNLFGSHIRDISKGMEGKQKDQTNPKQSPPRTLKNSSSYSTHNPAKRAPINKGLNESLYKSTTSSRYLSSSIRDSSIQRVDTSQVVPTQPSLKRTHHTSSAGAFLKGRPIVNSVKDGKSGVPRDPSFDKSKGETSQRICGFNIDRRNLIASTLKEELDPVDEEDHQELRPSIRDERGKLVPPRLDINSPLKAANSPHQVTRMLDKAITKGSMHKQSVVCCKVTPPASNMNNFNHSFRPAQKDLILASPALRGILSAYSHPKQKTPAVKKPKLGDKSNNSDLKSSRRSNKVGDSSGLGLTQNDPNHQSRMGRLSEEGAKTQTTFDHAALSDRLKESANTADERARELSCLMPRGQEPFGSLYDLYLTTPIGHQNTPRLSKDSFYKGKPQAKSPDLRNCSLSLTKDTILEGYKLTKKLGKQ
jgi:hypothetical protein